MVAHHFGSKHDLWLATVEHMRERALKYCEEVPEIQQSQLPIDTKCMQAMEHLYETMAREERNGEIHDARAGGRFGAF